MRRITVFEHMSADGYFTSHDGTLAWTVPDEELDRMGRFDVEPVLLDALSYLKQAARVSGHEVISACLFQMRNLAL